MRAIRQRADNYEMHAKYGIGFLQMEIKMAVLGDLGRYRTGTCGTFRS